MLLPCDFGSFSNPQGTFQVIGTSSKETKKPNADEHKHFSFLKIPVSFSVAALREEFDFIYPNFHQNSFPEEPWN